jgi:hypothetical protein
MKPMIIKVCKLLIFADGYGNNIILMQIFLSEKANGIKFHFYKPQIFLRANYKIYCN